MQFEEFYENFVVTAPPIPKVHEVNSNDKEVSLRI